MADQIQLNIYGEQACQGSPLAKLTLDCKKLTWRLVPMMAGKFREGKFKAVGTNNNKIECYENSRVYLRISGLSLTEPGKAGRRFQVTEHAYEPTKRTYSCYARLQ